MPFTEPPPEPPPVTVALVDDQGRQTPAFREYLLRMREWLVRLAAAIP